jgi:hypothetical protein
MKSERNLTNMRYDKLNPLEKFNLFVNATINGNYETADLIEKDLGLDKVPYPYENMD